MKDQRANDAKNVNDPAYPGVAVDIADDEKVTSTTIKERTAVLDDNAPFDKE